MKVWEIHNRYGMDYLRLGERPEPRPGAGQVVVDIKAVSLNYRDIGTVLGHAGQFPLPLVLGSDGAGEIVGVGDGVSRVKLGDRVCAMFYQSWLSGTVTADARSRPLGGPLDGVFQENVLLDAEGVAKFPEHLTYEEAATLPCAGLTAWRAIAVEAKVGAGNSVLVQGTGGVSTFALQFAKALGATVIATSSSDEKLARAKSLGADMVINYRTTPDWGRKARALTGGQGVDVVVDVGGENTLPQSFEAARLGGTIIVVGLLGGLTSSVSIPTLFSKNLNIKGISVGSREHFEQMVELIQEQKLKPVVGKIFEFEQLPEALQLMQAGGHFGKIVMRV